MSLRTMTDQLLILHISDFHFGKLNPYSGSWNHFCDIFDEIKKKFEDYDITFSDINLVLFTGDFTSEASENDFDYAKQFITEVLIRYFAKEKLVIIPGNHDLEWNKVNGQKHPLRFKAFLDFKKELDLMDEEFLDETYLDKPHFIKIFDEEDACILGLNSCLYNSYDLNPSNPDNFKNSTFNEDSKNNTHIHIENLKSILKDDDVYKSYPYKIALMHHHPLSFNIDNDGYKKSLQALNALTGKGFEVVLHGHLHRSLTHSIEHALIVGAGSFYTRKDDRDESNQISLISFYYETDPFLQAKIWKIHVFYDKEKDNLVTIDKPKHEVVGISKKYHEMIKQSYFKLYLHAISGRILRAQKEALNIYEIMSEKMWFDPTYKLKGIAQDYAIFLNALKTIGKITKKDYLVLRKLDFSPQMKETLEPLKTLDWFKLIKLKKPISRHIEKTSKKISTPTPFHFYKPGAFAWSPIRRLMKSAGAEIVSRSAVDALIAYMGEFGKELTAKALEITKHSKRKKITEKDMKLAIELI